MGRRGRIEKGESSEHQRNVGHGGRVRGRIGGALEDSDSSQTVASIIVHAEQSEYELLSV